MGAGIAHAFLLAGSRVVVVDATPEAVRAAHGRIESSLAAAAEKQALAEDPGQILTRLTTSVDTSAVAPASLVIEAVPELVGLKTEVLSKAQSEAPDAWLATNTSSLSINAIASGLERSERLIGLHFFNPVPVSDLVEIIVGKKTAPELTALSAEIVKGLGKTAITVTDSPGFATSRLGVAIALEAMRMVQEDVASAEDVDEAMRLGYRHQMGPLRTSDIVGLDVRLAIAKHLSTELGDRFEPPAILLEKVAAGELGRKTGKGFFEW